MVGWGCTVSFVIRYVTKWLCPCLCPVNMNDGVARMRPGHHRRQPGQRSASRVTSGERTNESQDAVVSRPCTPKGARTMAQLGQPGRRPLRSVPAMHAADHPAARWCLSRGSAGWRPRPRACRHRPVSWRRALLGWWRSRCAHPACCALLPTYRRCPGGRVPRSPNQSIHPWFCHWLWWDHRPAAPVRPARSCRRCSGASPRSAVACRGWTGHRPCADTRTFRNRWRCAGAAGTCNRCIR